MSGLNSKHQLFCDEYLSNGLNATQAYKSVYKVSDKVAGASGVRLLENARIKEYIQEQQQITSERLQITKEQIIQDLVDIKNQHKETRSLTSIKAIEVINKMLGFNAPDRQDITISEEPPLFSDDDLEE